MVGHPGLLTGALPAAACKPPGPASGQRRAGGAITATALLLLGLVQWQPAWALVVKAMLDPLFHSTSTGATLACLGLAALGGLGLALDMRLTLRSMRWLAACLLAGTVLGNAANLAAHLALLQQQGLPWSLAVYHWAGDTNTYSYLLHTHAGKAALHVLFSGWASPLVQGFDIGGGLASQLPPAWGLVCAAALLLAVLAWAALLPAVVAQVPTAMAWPVGLLFSFCALNAAKSIADGGPLTYRFAPVLAVLLWLLPGLLRLGPTWRWPAAAAGLAGVLGSGWLSWQLAGPQAGEALGGAATTLAILGLLAAWAWPARQPGTRRLRAWAATVGALGLVGSQVAALLGSPAALLLPLPDGMQATSCLPAQACRRLPVAGQRAFDVYRQLGDDPLKPRHTLLAPDGADGASRLLVAIVPLQTGTASSASGNPAQPPVHLAALQPLPNGAGVLVAASSSALPRIFLATPGPFSAANYHVFLHLAAAGLRSQGLTAFTLAPLRHQQDAVALDLVPASTNLPTQWTIDPH